MFTATTLDKWVSWLNDLEEERLDSEDHPNPRSLKKWDDLAMWKEVMTTHLRKLRGSASLVPLDYFIQNEISPEAQALKMVAQYDSIDEDLVAKILLDGNKFTKDNKKVLKTLLIKAPFWAFVERFNTKQDGRAAWFAVIAQAEGQSGTNLQKSQAFAAISNARYTGKGCTMTFDNYVEKSLKSMLEMKHRSIRKAVGAEPHCVTKSQRSINNSRRLRLAWEEQVVVAVGPGNEIGEANLRPKRRKHSC
jgi:hypothetical protein